MCDSENKPRQTNNIQVNIEQLQIILPKGDGETSLQINDKGQLSFSYTTSNKGTDNWLSKGIDDGVVKVKEVSSALVNNIFTKTKPAIKQIVKDVEQYKDLSIKLSDPVGGKILSNVVKSEVSKIVDMAYESAGVERIYELIGFKKTPDFYEFNLNNFKGTLPNSIIDTAKLNHHLESKLDEAIISMFPDASISYAIRKNSDITPFAQAQDKNGQLFKINYLKSDTPSTEVDKEKGILTISKKEFDSSNIHNSEVVKLDCANVNFDKLLYDINGNILPMCQELEINEVTNNADL